MNCFDLGGDVCQYVVLGWNIEFIDNVVNGVEYVGQVFYVIGYWVNVDYCIVCVERKFFVDLCGDILYIVMGIVWL